MDTTRHNSMNITCQNDGDTVTIRRHNDALVARRQKESCWSWRRW